MQRPPSQALAAGGPTAATEATQAQDLPGAFGSYLVPCLGSNRLRTQVFLHHDWFRDGGKLFFACSKTFSENMLGAVRISKTFLWNSWDVVRIFDVFLSVEFEDY